MFDEMQSLALRLAPELAGAGLTILEHQPGWDCPRGATAYCLRGPSLPIRDYLIASDRWPGSWGSFIVFTSPIPAWKKAVGILLHELSHIVPAVPPIADSLGETDAEATAYQSGLFAAMIALQGQAEDYQPWRGHDSRFIRRAIHLHHRASMLNVDVSLKDIAFAGPRYCLSGWADYELALGTEPLRMRGATFTEIARTPPPPKFAELFAGDVARFTYDRLMESEL